MVHPKRFLRDRRGNSVIEFAFMFPILILLLFGAIEITNMIMVNRKVVATAQSLADLVAQYEEVTTDDFTQFADAVGWMLHPFPDSDSDYGIAHVAFDSAQVASIDSDDGGWVRDEGLSVDDPTGRTAGMGLGDDAILVIELTYDYRPVVGTMILDSSPITFRHFAFARPRNEPRIILDTN
jgi:hypothetical protein